MKKSFFFSFNNLQRSIKVGYGFAFVVCSDPRTAINDMKNYNSTCYIKKVAFGMMFVVKTINSLQMSLIFCL